MPVVLDTAKSRKQSFWRTNFNANLNINGVEAYKTKCIDCFK